MAIPSDPSAAGSRVHICLLASGSSGNAIYIGTPSTAVLVDAGLSGIEIERRMHARGLDPAALRALVVTHEHNDHIRGIGVLSRRYHLPVFATAATIQAAPANLGRLHHFEPLHTGTSFAIGDLGFHPFSISHDARDPCGFTVTTQRTKIGVATDMGMVTEMVRTHLQGCTALILEANHDPDMLLNGPYPWPLKQRIRGRSGHLSNPETRDLLASLLHDRLRHVVLAHLSEQNNTAERALAAVGPALQQSHAMLTVALQHTSTDLLSI